MRSPPLSLLVPMFIGLAWAVFLVVLYFTGQAGTWGKLVDSDCYMWLIREQTWWQGGSWYDTYSYRDNTPWGHSMHWSRLFDLLLMGPTLFLTPFLGFSTSLWIWSVMLSPVLFVFMLVSLIWAVRPILNHTEQWVVAILIGFQPLILGDYAPARPDHQSLNGLLFVLNLGGMLRILGEKPTRGHYLGLGLTLALALWSSLEALSSLLVMQITLAGYYLTQGQEWAQRATRLLASLLGFILAALFLHRPWGGLGQAGECDSLSHMQVVLFGWMIGGWWLLSHLPEVLQKTVGGRFLSMLSIGLVFICAYHQLYPAFFHGPYGQVSPEVLTIWMNRVQEAVPMWMPGFISNAGGQMYLVLMVVAAGSGFYAIIRGKAERAALVHWVVSFIGFLLLSLFVACRWQVQVWVMAIPLVAILFQRVLIPHRYPEFMRVGLIFSLWYLPFIFHWMANSLVRVSQQGGANATAFVAKNSELPRGLTELPTFALADFLDQAQFGQRERILTLMNLGTEIIYRTRHEVVSSPYHRNGAGILDEYQAFTNPDEHEVNAILKKREISLILFCPTAQETESYYPHRAGTLAEKLRQHRPPEGMEEISLPAPLGHDFTLWRVHFDKL